MFTLALFLFFLMGITLGVFGGGGALLSLPIFVYLLDVSPTLATQYSLILVGLSALFGFATQRTSGLMDLKKIVIFLVPSLLSVFVVRTLVLSVWPESFVVFDLNMQRDTLLMFLLAAVLLVSATKMRSSKAPVEVAQETKLKVALSGLGVGALAGALGAGGGFLIVPALTLFLGIEMKKAVRSSLLIISLQSFFGFIVGLAHVKNFDYSLLAFSALVAVIGILVASPLSKKLPADKLKSLFSSFMIIIALVIFAEKLYSIMR